MKFCKISGSDKVAQATGYYADRQSLNRALRRERDGFLNLYGGPPEYPLDCLFWYEANREEPVSYQLSTATQRAGRKWKLCSRPEFAQAFGDAMRSKKERVRPAIAAYLDAETDERRDKIAREKPWVPLLVRKQKLVAEIDAGLLQPNWDDAWQNFDDQFMLENSTDPTIAEEIVARLLKNGALRSFKEISEAVDWFTPKQIREMIKSTGAIQVGGEIECWKLMKN